MPVRVGDGMSKQTLVLPAPPTANHRLFVRDGRMIKSKSARAYQKMVQLAARTNGCVCLTGPVAVELHWHRKYKRGDLDNRFKNALDALKGVCWIDDSQIVELHAYRHDNGDDTITVSWYTPS